MPVYTASRRGALFGATAVTAAAWIPLKVFAQKNQAKAKSPPGDLFKPSAKGDGMIGPWGEVRAKNSNVGTIPYFIQSADKQCTFDFRGRNYVLTLGEGATQIVMTSNGIAVGKAKPVPWSKNAIVLLKSILKARISLLRSATMLRSAILTAYPALLATAKQKSAKLMSGAYRECVDDVVTFYNCTTTRVTETVSERIEQTSNIILTAEQQYQKCYDEEIKKGTCWSNEVCIALLCGAQTFVDVVVGVVSTFIDVVTEVTREVVTCATGKLDYLPNPYTGQKTEVATVSPNAESVTQSAINQALNFLRNNCDAIFDFLGPFGRCLARGNWSLASLPPIAGIGIPYGISVDITSDCARELAASNMVQLARSGWEEALGALAAVSSDFALKTGITGTAAVVTAVAALPEPALAALAVILAFIIGCLFYASAISVQLSSLPWWNPTAYDDGRVRITHPSLAIAMIMVMTLGQAAILELIPPIVTG